MARPTKLTPLVREALVKAVRMGAPRAVAARAAGVSEQTLYRWLATGRTETRGPHRRLFEELEQAQGKAQLQAIGCWVSAMKHDWRACERYLVRTDPANWNKHRDPPAPSEQAADASTPDAGDGLERLLAAPLDGLDRLSDKQLDQLEKIRRAASEDGA